MAVLRYYITTTIPYVNGRPHMGHAEEFVQTDVFGRYHRLRGDDTYVLTGTDENSLTNVLAAEAEGLSPRQLVDRNSLWFQGLADDLGLQYDQFIRTAVDPRHLDACHKIWRAVEANGDIYKKTYSGLYCPRCELYYDEDELVDGLCPEHRIRPDLVEEENYFFRLSAYGDALRDLITSDTLHIIPDFRRNEVLSFIAGGLQDFSISRSQTRAHGWGIPVPGDPSQVMYVWVDALTNYISALGYHDADGPGGDLYRRYWLENPDRIHALGKGVIRFHAIYWPAMLLSAGIPLPVREFVHGYINIAGAKMSKTLGNVVDPAELVREYGAEAVRYFVLRGVHPVRDADFADVDHFYDQLRSRYTADLANDLGNLLNRTVSMVVRYRSGEVPEAGEAGETEKSIRAIADRLALSVPDALDKYDPQSALASLWELVTRANRYVEETKPWELAKAVRGGDTGAEARLSTVLYTLAEAVRLVGAGLEPFLPDTARRITEQLGVDPTGAWLQRLEWGGLQPGTRTGAPQPLFPRREDPVAAS
ncbi:MAG: methionine--tRNA ligase [Chloroflexota bacterium]